jgi:hypothetical protein
MSTPDFGAADDVLIALLLPRLTNPGATTGEVMKWIEASVSLVRAPAHTYGAL